MTNQNEGWDTIEVPSKDEDNKIEFEVESEEEKPIEAVEELQYSQYFENHFLGWHRDIVHEKARAAKSNRPELDRKISISIQLSDPSEYLGGMLEINQNESGDEEVPNLSDAQNRTGERDIRDLVRPKGSIIAFPSAIRHRVSPIRKGCRRALVAWIGGRD